MWIGFDSDQLTFTRLDLRPDLTGFCARVSPADTMHDQGVHVYRVTTWSVKDWNIEIQMSPVSNATDVGYVKGRMGLASIRLTIGGPENGGWKEEPFLHPEPRIMTSNQETREGIEKAEKNAQTSPPQPSGAATQFKPGESGNPGGRPKGVIGAKLLAQLLASDEENLLAIVEAVIAQARKGNTKAFAEIRNTVDGPPAQALTGAEGGPIFHVIRYEKDPPTPDVKIPDKPALPVRTAATPSLRVSEKPTLAARPEPEDLESTEERAQTLENLRRAGQDMSRAVDPAPRPAWGR